MLKRFSMKNSKRGLLSLRHEIYLSKKICLDTFEEIQCLSKIPNISPIGSLMYTILRTQPDIAFAMSVTRWYQSNSSEEYWIAMKNIFKYLRKIKNLFLIFRGGSELKVEGYTDSDFISDVNDRGSTSKCIFLCNEDLVSWNSFKQSIIADLTI